MTTTENAGQTDPEFHLPSDPPGWTAFEIIYTFYTRDSAGNVISKPGSYVVCRKTIAEFIKDVCAGGPLPPSCYVRHKHKQDPAIERPIDIYVGCKSYVVIELDRGLDWRFKKGRPGVTTKEDYGDDNWGLRHVMPDGAEYGNEGPKADDCRIVYFAMNERRKEYERQHFRLHVVSGKGREDPVQIDPDIPNDGGKFPGFPRSPCLGTQEGAPHCK